MDQLLISVIVPIFVALVTGTGLWSFLSSTRSATSSEYKQFVKDLQQERRDRETALTQLREELESERDARVEQTLLIGEIVGHVDKLETMIRAGGGTVPPKPTRLQQYIDRHN
jgi:hypothetical protein